MKTAAGTATAEADWPLLPFRFLFAVTAAILLPFGRFAGPDLGGNLAGLSQIGFALLNGSAGSRSFPALSGPPLFPLLAAIYRSISWSLWRSASSQPRTSAAISRISRRSRCFHMRAMTSLRYFSEPSDSKLNIARLASLALIFPDSDALFQNFGKRRVPGLIGFMRIVEFRLIKPRLRRCMAIWRFRFLHRIEALLRSAQILVVVPAWDRLRVPAQALVAMLPLHSCLLPGPATRL